jgi:hypothetical protein
MGRMDRSLISMGNSRIIFQEEEKELMDEFWIPIS